MEELVSIIMPSYNTADYISLSIDSVLNQSYQNWELIIVDDCSNDGTDEVINDYLSDSRIRYYKNSKNLGAAQSRNRALQLATGKWIAFLDSDDLWSSSKLQEQIDFMNRFEYKFSYTNYSEIDLQGNKTGKTITGPKRISEKGFINYCWPGCLTVMYDRESIGLIQIADLKKNNDYAMWLKVSKCSDCYLLDRNLAFYRRGRTGSISATKYSELIRWHYLLFRIAENKTICESVVCAFRNIIFGIAKKILYVKTA